MRPDYHVRPARMEDVDCLSDFQVAMALESEGMSLDRATVRHGIQSFLSQPDHGFYYVITAGDATVGCAMVQYEWSDWRAKRVLWLHSVYVLPQFRRNGCFRTLYAFLQDKVQSNPDLAGIRLYVDKKNTQAEDTYRRLGMTDEHYKLFEWLKSEG
jgi:ribosomal protein S18 acetylase RimI-like enzyme